MKGDINMFWIGLIIGLFAGTSMGVALMALLCCASNEDEDKNDRLQK